jgi:mannose-6-phosphate isomerase-like protein (cupin superfamily)
VVFGVQVENDAWTVTANRSAEGKAAAAHLTKGAPAIPTFVWAMSRETFDKITSGQMSAITASAKAFSRESAPLEVETLNGFKPTKDWAQTVMRPLYFHFWTMGQPEVAQFGFDRSRLVHGGRAIPAVYAPGIRTSWYGILKGDHINKDPRSQKDPWSSAFFIIKGGTGGARIGDEVIKLEDNSMIHVPPQTEHEFWNNGDVPAEMIMVTYGTES